MDIRVSLCRSIIVFSVLFKFYPVLGFDVISLLTLQLDAAQSKVKTFAPRLDPSSL